MKEYKADIQIKAIYNADSEEEVKNMIYEEYSLGDVENYIDIEEVK